MMKVKFFNNMTGFNQSINQSTPDKAIAAGNQDMFFSVYHLMINLSCDFSTSSMA